MEERIANALEHIAESLEHIEEVLCEQHIDVRGNINIEQG